MLPQLSPVQTELRPSARPVPQHLFGTRAALFYLWGGPRPQPAGQPAGQPGRPAPGRGTDALSALRHAVQPGAMSLSGNLPGGAAGGLSGLLDDVFIFH